MKVANNYPARTASEINPWLKPTKIAGGSTDAAAAVPAKVLVVETKQVLSVVLTP